MVSCVELLVAQWVHKNRHNNSFKRNKENLCDLPEHGEFAAWIFHRSSVSSLDDCHVLSGEFSAWRNHFDLCGFTYQFNKRKRALLWQRRVERLVPDIRRRSILLRLLHGSTTSIYLLGARFFIHRSRLHNNVRARFYKYKMCRTATRRQCHVFGNLCSHVRRSNSYSHERLPFTHNVRVAHTRNKKNQLHRRRSHQKSTVHTKAITIY